VALLFHTLVMRSPRDGSQRGAHLVQVLLSALRIHALQLLPLPLQRCTPALLVLLVLVLLHLVQVLQGG
jgi:hypothetical protein